MTEADRATPETDAAWTERDSVEWDERQTRRRDTSRSLERQRDGLRDVIERDGKALDRQRAALEKAEAELAAVRKDAERYRWLRTQMWAEQSEFDSWFIATEVKCGAEMEPADFDAAIDAKREGGK